MAKITGSTDGAGWCFLSRGKIFLSHSNVGLIGSGIMAPISQRFVHTTSKWLASQPFERSWDRKSVS